MEYAIEDLSRIITELATAVVNGNLGVRANTDAFDGTAKQIIQSFNVVLDTLTEPLNAATETLERLSKGELPPPLIDDYKGDLQRVKDAVNTLIAVFEEMTQIACDLADGKINFALRGVGNVISQFLEELQTMSNAVAEGRLDMRGNANQFQGEFANAVRSVNTIIALLVRPLNVTVEYVERIAGGNTPAPITDEYKGRFNDLKSALNALIDSTNTATESLRSLADGKLDIAIPKRSSKDHLMSAAEQIRHSLRETVSANADLTSRIHVLRTAEQQFRRQQEALEQANNGLSQRIQELEAQRTAIQARSAALEKVQRFIEKHLKDLQLAHKSQAKSLSLIHKAFDAAHSELNPVASRTLTRPTRTTHEETRGQRPRQSADDSRQAAAGSRQAAGDSRQTSDANHQPPPTIQDDRAVILPQDKRVLIIEGAPKSACLLLDLVRQQGFKGLLASDGAAGLRLASQYLPNAILLNINLLQINGWTVVEKLHANPDTRHIPVHFLAPQEQAFESITPGDLEALITAEISVETGDEVLQQLEAHEDRELNEHQGTQDGETRNRFIHDVAIFLQQALAELPLEQHLKFQINSADDAILKGKTLLLADQDMHSVYTLTTVCEEKGLHVQFAESGQEALQHLETTPEIDLVLIDAAISGTEDCDFIKAIRQQPRFKKLPIIALNAVTMPADRHHYLAAGANDCLVKPVEPEKLLSLLRVWLY